MFLSYKRLVRHTLLLCATGMSCLAGCGVAVPNLGAFFPGGPTDPLTAGDVTTIITQAARALGSEELVIAVTDREGNILGLFRKNEAPTTGSALLAGSPVEAEANELAVSLARTGAFFSNDEAPLSSRTVRFISREHFPPTFDAAGRVTGVKNTPSGALWNIEGTNRGCPLSMDFNPGQEVAPSRSVDGSAAGLGIATIPGGVPLFKGGMLVGGVGVCGVSPEAAEFAAFVGSSGFGPTPASPGEIFIDGVRLPFVEQTTRPFGTGQDFFDDLSDVGSFVSIPDLVTLGAMISGTQDSPRAQVPEGWLVGPKASPELSAAEVASIISNCIFRAQKTRAAIRLPLDRRTKMIISVAALDGEILGLYRMPDATVFSIDVAATKARNMAYFNSFERTAADLPGVPLGTAITNRTLRFGTQPFFPPGINSTFPGPFRSLLLDHFDNPCSQGDQPPNPNQSGIVFFPGSAALYRSGFVLVGGLGVSGDGVDQDDYVTEAGLRGYEAAVFLRADRTEIRGVTLPYLKFPRAPEE